MNPLRALVRLTSVLLLMLGAVQHSGQNDAASKPKMDYWYIETLEVGSVELLDGVGILASDPSSQPRGFFVLENQTEPPL